MSEFKWNCSFTSKEFTLTEMDLVLEPFYIIGTSHRHTYGHIYQERDVLVDLAIYEYIDPRQGAVRCGIKKLRQAFKSSTKI